MIFLKNIPILVDNYIWILYDTQGFCIIIDPGSSNDIIKEIEKKWRLVAILLTHNHSDHTDGVKNIIERYPYTNVFGPNEIKNNYVNKIVKHGDQIILLNQRFYVLSTPGHTTGHVSYYTKPYLFCGDTLFSAGCGRVYQTNYLDMYNSIKLISNLPNNTILCCAHEYTLSNLYFSIYILPQDKNIKNYLNKIKKIISLKKISLPSYIFFEKKINLFLRTDEFILKKAIGLKENCSELDTFINLRLKKDNFIWS